MRSRKTALMSKLIKKLVKVIKYYEVRWHHDYIRPHIDGILY